MTKPQENSHGRPWHILRPVKGESVPERLLVFQVEPLSRRIEGDLWEHTFRLGAGACYWLKDGKIVDQETTVFRSREDWSRWVTNSRVRNRCTWIYSYGLVYGLTLLDAWRLWTRSGENVTSAVLSDPPSIVLTRLGRRVTRYVDAANYQRDGLRALLRTTCQGTLARANCGASDADATDYCLSKTLAVGEFLCQAISLVRKTRLCGWQPTAASLSFAAYRHSFNSQCLYIHGHSEALSLERDTLFGGRVQTWRHGCVNEPVTIVDANSLYPYVMRDYPHPVKFRNHQWGGTVRELAQAVRGYHCVGAVELAQSALDLPRRVGGRLYWDGSPGVRYLGGAELRQACARGDIHAVHALARYDYGFPFTGFVDSLFALKLRLTKEENHAQAALVKMLLNSLHGKFAQKGRRWREAPQTPAGGRWCSWWGRHPTTGAIVPYRNLGGYSQFCEEAGEWNNSFPALSASIACAARVELARAKDIAGADQTLYCDTDSLHVIGDGLNRMVSSDLVHPTCLGKWKVVTRGEDANYWCLKFYRVGSKYCCNYLTASAWQVADGVYRDAARLHFGHLLSEGLPDAVYYKERTVRVRDFDQAERMEVVDYEDVA